MLRSEEELDGHVRIAFVAGRALFFCFRNYLIACFLFGRVMSLYLGLPIMNSPTEHSALLEMPEACSNNSLLPKLNPQGAS